MMQEVDLAKVIDAAMDLASDEFSSRGLEVERSIETTLPTLYADPDLLVQAVYELVVNAAEAAEANGSIRIRAFASDDSVSLEVADNGPGMDPEKLREIFRPFFSTKAAHRGLGFLLLRKILHAHNGQIEVLTGSGTGHEGQGACVQIRLPVASGIQRPANGQQ